jgi:hypothetical protein
MLNLCDNQIHAEGGRYIGRALRRNESLIELNMRLNRLTDEGGRMLLEGLRDNGSLQLLNLSSNSLAQETTKSFSSLLRKQYCALVAVDLSNNEINDTDLAEISEVVQDNMSVTSLDLRGNSITKGNQTLMDIASTYGPTNCIYGNSSFGCGSLIIQETGRSSCGEVPCRIHFILKYKKFAHHQHQNLCVCTVVRLDRYPLSIYVFTYMYVPSN